MRLLVEFIFFALNSHGNTNCEYESVSSHKDVPNVFFKDVYFLRVGARGSLFIGTLSFCNGCQTYSCWVKNGIILFICTISLVCESFIVCNSIKTGQAFFSLYSFFSCECPVCKEQVVCVEMRQVIVVWLSVYWGRSTASLWSTYIYVAALFRLWLFAIIKAASPALFGHSP